MHNPIRYFWQRQVKVIKHLSIDSHGLKVIRTCLRSSHVPFYQGCAKQFMPRCLRQLSAARIPGDMSKTEREVISMFSEVSHAFGMTRRGDTCRIHAMTNNIFIQVRAPDVLTFQNTFRTSLCFFKTKQELHISNLQGLDTIIIPPLISLHYSSSSAGK